MGDRHPYDGRALSKRLLVAASALAGLLALAGCYGSTEPATDIAFDNATLNGKGTTNNGPAAVYFEYWPTSDPSNVSQTLRKDIPGGVTGPISIEATPFHTGLRVDTPYSFRLCATDRGSPNGACAQTRTFRTAKPAGDFVGGVVITQIGGVGHDGGVRAQSSASGANASGSLRIPDLNGNALNASVTCLSVRGNQAVVGGLGTRTDGTPAAGIMKLSDEPDQVNFTITDHGSAPNCANEPIGELFSGGILVFSVYDTPEGTPTAR